MKKIIDSNYCSDSKVINYLSESKNNFVILCDFSGVEAYKAKDPIDAMYDSLFIFKDFTKQVLILKSGRQIAAQKISKKRYLSRMFDSAQTQGFADFCKHIDLARQGVEPYKSIALNLAKAAIEDSKKALEAAENHSSASREAMKDFTANEFKSIKLHQDLSNDLFRKIVTHVCEMTIYSFEKLNINIRKTNFQDVINSLTFRQILCNYLMVLRWHAEGTPPTNIKNIRNHVYDCGFASYATFFDGLLTNDEAAQVSYTETKKFLNRLSKEVNLEIISAKHPSM